MAKAKFRFTEEEEIHLTGHLREVAVAYARYWDVLRDLELKYDKEFETPHELISDLAGSCKCPPSYADLDIIDIAESFYDYLVVND